MTTTNAISEFYKDIRASVEDLHFLARDGVHAEGELAAVEIVAASRGHDRRNLVVDLRPYSLLTEISPEQRTLLREVLDELSSHRDVRVSEAAAIRREQVEAPGMAAEDLEGIELWLFCDEAEEPARKASTDRRGRAVFRDVPAEAWCRVRMAAGHLATTRPTGFALPPVFEYRLSGEPAASAAGDARPDPLPVGDEVPNTHGRLLWQLYRDDADQIVLGLLFYPNPGKTPGGVTVELSAPEGRTGGKPWSQSVALAPDHHGIWRARIILSGQLELSRATSIDYEVSIVAASETDCH